MSLELFFSQFSLITTAPNGVARLREMILDLAVRGQLVEQSDGEEPAHKLLEKIRAEKKRISGEKGKAKLFDEVLSIDEIGAPFTIPENWVWTTLRQAGFVSPRNEIDDELEVSFVPMTLIPAGYGKKISSEIRQWKDIKKGFTHFAEGDVALAKITPCFQNGKSAVMQNLKNGFGAGTTELHVFRPIEQTISPEYVLIYLKSSHYLVEGIPRMTGTAGQKRVPTDYFADNYFPLPPLKEQKRIVEKVEELMRLCNKIENLLQEKQAKSSVLLSSLISHV